MKVAVAWPLALAALTGLNLLTLHHLEDLGFIFIYGPVLSFVGLALAGVAAFINWHNPRLVTLALVLNGVLAFIGLIIFFSYFNSLA